MKQKLLLRVSRSRASDLNPRPGRQFRAMGSLEDVEMSLNLADASEWVEQDQLLVKHCAKFMYGRTFFSLLDWAFNDTVWEGELFVGLMWAGVSPMHMAVLTRDYMLGSDDYRKFLRSCFKVAVSHLTATPDRESAQRTAGRWMNDELRLSTCSNRFQYQDADQWRLLVAAQLLHEAQMHVFTHSARIRPLMGVKWPCCQCAALTCSTCRYCDVFQCERCHELNHRPGRWRSTRTTPYCAWWGHFHQLTPYWWQF